MVVRYTIQRKDGLSTVITLPDTTAPSVKSVVSVLYSLSSLRRALWMSFLTVFSCSSILAAISA